MTSSLVSATQPQEHTTDALLEMWRQSLVLPGFEDPIPSALRELSLYFDISEHDVLERCRRWEHDSVTEWAARDRDTSEGLLDFYRTTQSWIFDTVWYHAQQYHGTVPAESVMIAERLRGRIPGRHLDFGSGPGSTSLFFQKLGWQVALADISTTLLQFARWRFERRHLDATFYDLSADSLPDQHFDLITACDVMVHVPDPEATFRKLHRALKVGGLLIFNVDASPNALPWHLHPYAYPVLRPVRGLGFQRLPRLEFFHVYRKVGQRPDMHRLAIYCYDTVRYSLATTRVGRFARKMRPH